MKSNPFARHVNVERLEPVTGLYRSPEAAVHDEPPPCPGCGGEAMWFIDRPDAPVELVCLECESTHFNRGPIGGGRADERCATTAEQLTRHARAYGDEHFPGWREIAVRISMGGSGGELVLALVRRPAPPGSDGPPVTIGARRTA